VDVKYKVTVPYSIPNSIEPFGWTRSRWLEENIGPRKGKWKYIGVTGEGAIYCFAKDEDAMLFALRWM
jgi:hypothetical protein